MVWIVLIGAYALIITFFILLKSFHSRESKLMSELRKVADSENIAASERFKSLCEVAKLQQGQISWYERGLSTIGIVAFLAMLITTGVQTINAANESYKADKLRSEVDKLRLQKNDAEIMVSDVANAVMEIYTKTGELDKAGRTILNHRLDQLDDAQITSNETIIEMYKIALFLGEFEKAVDLLDEHLQLLDSTKFTDQISLAEYYYITGGYEQAKDIVEQLNPKRSAFPKLWVFKLIVLSTLLDPDRNMESKIEHYSKQVASIFNCDSEEAKRRLAAEVRIFQRASGY